MQWEQIGRGPTDDTSTMRTEVPGGWLYAIVASEPARYSGSDESFDSARILALTFVPGRRNPVTTKPAD